MTVTGNRQPAPMTEHEHTPTTDFLDPQPDKFLLSYFLLDFGTFYSDSDKLSVKSILLIEKRVKEQNNIIT